VQDGKSSSQALAKVDPALRPGVQAISFHGLRWWGRASALRQLLAPKRPDPAVDALLCLALALGWREEDAPYDWHTLVNQTVEAAKRDRGMLRSAGFINACLRRFTQERADLLDEACQGDLGKWNHPAWWVKRLRQDHPQHWQDVLRASNVAAPLVLRCKDKNKTLRSVFIDSVAIKNEVIQVGDLAYAVTPAVDVTRIEGFTSGEVSVQDAAAQLAAPLLLDGLEGSNLRVLDACAAPGGKTLHLLQHRSQVRVVALEQDASRCERIMSNIERGGEDVKARFELRVADAGHLKTWRQEDELFDAVLLDAPCTASGIVRRHPDVRWLRRESDIAQLAGQQKRLLDALWACVKPGGRLLYATCSVFKAEGEDQAKAFESRNTDALRGPAPGHMLPRSLGDSVESIENPNSEPAVRTPSKKSEPVDFPRPLDHDGFFYALFTKKLA
jgi:16S rRNA (cytosine967-C5)-methyltransferase